MPEKRVIGNQGADFIEERQRGLTSFMRQVALNPYLRNDHTFRAFLTVIDTGAGEWEQAKKVRRLAVRTRGCRCGYGFGCSRRCAPGTRL